jgi:hypothetical protein
MAAYYCRCVGGDFMSGTALISTTMGGRRFKRIRLKRRGVFSYLPFVGRRRFRSRDIQTVQLLSQVTCFLGIGG